MANAFLRTDTQRIEVVLRSADATVATNAALVVGGAIRSDVVALDADAASNSFFLEADVTAAERAGLRLALQGGDAVIDRVLVDGVAVDPATVFDGQGRDLAGDYELDGRGTLSGSTAYGLDLDDTVDVRLTLRAVLFDAAAPPPKIDVFVDGVRVADDIAIFGSGQVVDIDVPVDLDLSSVMLRPVDRVGTHVAVVQGIEIDGRALELADAIIGEPGVDWGGNTDNLWLRPGDSHFDTRPTTNHQLELYIGGEDWQGDPRFTLRIDGVTFASDRLVTADARAGEFQRVVFSVPEGLDLRDAELLYTNDANGGTAATDRNLVLRAVTFDGRTITGREALLDDAVRIAADGVTATLPRTGAYDLKLPLIEHRLALDYDAIADTHELIFVDDFDGTTPNADNAGRGLWSTEMPFGPSNRGAVVTLSSEVRAPDGAPLGIDPHLVRDGALTLDMGRIPDAVQDELYEYFRYEGGISPSNYDDAAGETTFDVYSGMITTHESWSQTYGYFEARARMAAVTPNWGSFWLMPVDGEHPPEFDIAEVPGTEPDHHLAAIHFDNYNEMDGTVSDPDFIDTGRTDVGEVNWDNESYDLENINFFIRDNGEQTAPHYALQHVNAINSPAMKTMLGYAEAADRNLFEDFFVYSMAWSEDEVIFYFGTDSHNQIEIGRTPLPPGADVTMYTILNRLGPVTPTDAQLDEALANDMDIDYVKIFAPKSATIDVRLDGDDVLGSGDAANNRLEGNALDNVLDGRLGLDWAVGNGGADLFVLRHGGTDFADNDLIVEDFTPAEGDKILLEGLYLLDAADAYASVHEVGDDVWLSRGAGGTSSVGPQTVILRDTRIADLAADDFVVRWGETRSPVNSSFSKLYETSGDIITVHGTDKNDLLSSFFGGGFFPVPRIDRLRGEAGDDTYRMTNNTAPIIERAGEGRDLVLLETSSFTLPDNVENLTVAASRGGRATVVGNDDDNVVRAHDRGLTVAGEGDDDLIVLGDGADVVHIGPGDGRDTIENFAGNDVVTFGAGFFASRSEVLGHLLQEGDDVALYLTADDAVRFRDARVDDFTAANFGFAVSLGQNLATHPAGAFADADHTPHVGDVPAWGPWLNGVGTPASGGGGDGGGSTPPPDDEPPPAGDGEAILPGPGLTATLNGAARFDGATGLFTLTPALANRVGSAMLDEPIDLDRDFTIVVDLNLGTSDAGADGMTLLLHNDPDGADALGLAGSTGATSIANGVAVDLDTYDNGATAGDIAADHTNIFDTDGGFTTAPFALANLEDGQPHRVALTWDASAARLAYSIDGADAGVLDGDIAATYIGSRFAYFGVTAGTGGAVNPHQARFVAIDATLADGRTVDWAAEAPSAPFDLVWSSSAARTAPRDLQDARLVGDVYVFLDDGGNTGIQSVAFYLDDTDASGTPLQIEGAAPWDLQGGFDTAASPWDTELLDDGVYDLTAEVRFTSGDTVRVTDSFTIDNTVVGTDLVWSDSADRSDAADLEGAELSGEAYVFLDPAGRTDIVEVSFWLDDPARSGAPNGIERSAPWDFQGGFAAAANPWETDDITPGGYSITAEVLFADGSSEIVSDSFEVVQPLPATDLLWSETADRSGAVDLAGAELSGEAYVFLDPAGRTDIEEVFFWLDDPDRSGAPTRIEGSAPWDLQGGFTTAANPWDTSAVDTGSHSITAEVLFADGSSEIVSDDFEVENATTDLVWSASSSRTAPADLAGATLSDEVYVFLDPAGRTDIEEVFFWLDDPDRSGAPTQTEASAPWDFQGGFATAAFAWSTSEVTDGDHSMTAEVHFTDGSSEAFTESFFVDNIL